VLVLKICDIGTDWRRKRGKAQITSQKHHGRLQADGSSSSPVLEEREFELSQFRQKSIQLAEQALHAIFVAFDNAHRHLRAEGRETRVFRLIWNSTSRREENRANTDSSAGLRICSQCINGIPVTESHTVVYIISEGFAALPMLVMKAKTFEIVRATVAVQRIVQPSKCKHAIENWGLPVVGNNRRSMPSVG
jgi:hypothetical protein